MKGKNINILSVSVRAYWLLTCVAFSAHMKEKENPHFFLFLIHVHICGNQMGVVLCLKLS